MHMMYGANEELELELGKQALNEFFGRRSYPINFGANQDA